MNGRGSVLPDGEHWNVLKFAGLNDLAAFMRKDSGTAVQVATAPAPERRRPQGAAVAGK